jgi:alpha-1,2-mannosyltransferase
MPGGASNSNTRRLLALIISMLMLAAVLAAKYGHKPDTATLQILAHALTSPVGTDSTLYMQMGDHAFRQPSHSIYRELFFVQHEKFIYPPSSLFLLYLLNAAPAVHVSTDAALFSLLLVSWVGTLAIGVWLYRLEKGSIRVVEAACIIVVGLLFLPIAEALYRGQIQLLLTFLWGVAVVLWALRKPAWAAFVLGLTCAFKPQLAIFLLWGVLRRQWRFTAVLATTVAFLAICSVAYFGLRNNLDYLSVLSYLSRHGEALWANQSFNGLLNRLFRNGDAMSWNLTVYPPYRPVIYIFSTAASVAVLIAALLIPRLGNWQSTLADFLFAGCSSVLISPIAWEHHYGYFFFLIVYVGARAGNLNPAVWTMVCACTLALGNRLPPLDHRMQGGISLISSYMLYSGIALLCVLAAEQSRRSARAL